MSAIIKLKYIIVFLWSGLFYFSYAGMGISRFVSLPELRSASVGFCIMDIETGEIVSSYDSQRLLLPASALKLLTSATVLILMYNIRGISEKTVCFMVIYIFRGAETLH